jgi:dephospho-CoA kinase
MLRISLTGGIGSGKSTVANYFSRLKIKVTDADLIAHQLLRKNTAPYRKTIAHFGEKILKKNQAINRKLLREIIFHRPQEKKWLEKLLHPLIIKQLQKESKKCRTKYCILVIPLFFEKKLFHLVDRILVIDSPISEQIKRIVKRDHTTKKQVQMIIAAQTPRAKRKKMADDLIYNNGDLIKLKKQVLALHQKYLSLSK